MTDDATRAQNDAANPQVSTWLSANAGSGKTRVLTDRVARILLRGTDPQSILCLTYTKAAANEMQNRLFQTLGEWSMLDDDNLLEQLNNLGAPAPSNLSSARTLFARAIETPGGLKIQTIHSFCASILRHFPLEAQISPQFHEMDDVAQSALIDEVLEGIADSQQAANVAQHFGGDLRTLAKTIISKAAHFTPDLPSAFAHFGLQPDTTLDTIAGHITDEDIALLKRIAGPLCASSSSTDQKLGSALAELHAGAGVANLPLLFNALLTQKGEVRARLGTKSVREGALAADVTQLDAIASATHDIRKELNAFNAAQKTSALHGFAHLLLPAYEEQKRQNGLLDFDDLISKTRDLLTSQSLAWVLYRLDGGISHILVDEAQDTSPAQWQVIKALADEITAGQGADTQENRTIFVVGDKKQSIYSFQGADARAFDDMSDSFERQLRHGAGLKRRELSYSFRSSPAILTAVDAVSRQPGVDGLGSHIGHMAFKPTLPGRVDLWPLIPKPESDEDPAWYDPVDRPAKNDPDVLLANTIAENVSELLESGSIPAKNGDFRPIDPGDIMILVQRRSRLFTEIIRACKAAELPIAGADRMKIAGELAVRDLLALLSFVALPEDSLSLACALRSPLFSWSEGDLFNLAAKRKQTHLWATLRSQADTYPKTLSMLQDLRNRAEFDRPFEILERILTRHDGRRNLLARLGGEAEDAINELLNQALNYERSNVPTLTGFLRQTQVEDIEIKRRSDTSGNLIRVMTVHGAKGLESPIVILPDTTRGERRQTSDVLLSDGYPIAATRTAESPAQTETARDALRQAEREERNRLLYVAMTRAETWLITCGTETRGEDAINWHGLIEAALRDCDATPINTPTGQGLRLSHGAWSDAATPRQSDDPDPTPAAPFFDIPVSNEYALLEPILPSDLGGAKVLGGGAYDEEAAKKRGRQIHLLLEHPGTDPLVLLSSGPDAAPPEVISELAAEAKAVVQAHPQLFTPETLAEVDITAQLSAFSTPISGTIDRLCIEPGKITAVDFKTNAITPDSPEDTPEGILRQMGAYLEALEQIWPDHQIEIAVLWTKSAKFTVLPHGIVRKALASTTTS